MAKKRSRVPPPTRVHVDRKKEAGRLACRRGMYKVEEKMNKAKDVKLVDCCGLNSECVILRLGVGPPFRFVAFTSARRPDPKDKDKFWVDSVAIQGWAGCPYCLSPLGPETPIFPYIWGKFTHIDKHLANHFGIQRPGMNSKE